MLNSEFNPRIRTNTWAEGDRAEEGLNQTGYVVGVLLGLAFWFLQ